MLNKLLDNSFFRFILVGILNTLLSFMVMLILYNFLHFGYWSSSAVAYILGSILSFWLNKSYTFRNNDSVVYTLLRFSINIVICYSIAFGIAKPTVHGFFNLAGTHHENQIIENIALFLGMCLFTVLNYFGQRLFVFGKNNNSPKGKMPE
ncbi:GtrA-like protein [Desulfitobacterium hafniense DP7]|uniref:GtrA-like protein n=1 Tax=Desulfitobacterium hafniense DP7 TaxID=537010 RepID=G9XVV5_DESHA|nr:GtrA family protein [Desulfitobacterium hafniense]EHL04218.1 GtrA-like protein [Desulfitobacterium hafniense DP7]